MSAPAHASPALVAALACGLLLAPGTARAGCDRPTSCTLVAAPCGGDPSCPPAYACVDGACRGGTCVGAADCAAGGDCVYALGAGGGACVCGGCAPWRCPLGCTLGVRSGCRCESIEDCPSEDDVCFRGVCS